MDAIVKLAQAAARQACGQEKTAFIGQNFLSGAFKAMAPVAKGSASALRSTPLTSVASKAAGGARQLSPMRMAATGAAAGLGGLAAKDAYQGATGQWSGENQLGWHRQRMQGQDYNASLGGWASPTAWGRTLGSPLKSTLAMGAGPGPDSIQGDPQISGGQWAPNPETGQQELLGGQITRKQTFAPHVQGKLQAYDRNQAQYDQMRRKQQELFQTEQTNYDTDNYGNTRWLGRGTVADQRAAQQAKLDEIQKQLGSGEYGNNNWFGGNNAAHYRDQADQLAPELRRIGALGQEAAKFSPAQFPGPPQAGPLDTDYSFLNYGM